MAGADDADRVGADGSPEVGYPGTGSITGSGRLISWQLDLPDVTTLIAGATFVVTVRVGALQQATVRMDDNLAESVEATVSDGQLRLGLTPGTSIRNATLSADVTVRHLDRLTVRDASKVTFDSEVTGAALMLETGGVSRIAGALRMDRVQVVASGASVLTLSGAAGHLDLRASGTARLRLPGLVVRDLDAVLSGASRVTVGVSDTLAVRTSGASTLSYRGAPRITRQQISGVSSIMADPPDGGGSFSGNRYAP